MMKPELENISLVHNEAKKHFELHVNNHIAYIEYSGFGNQTSLIHTIVPKELEGQGVGKTLVEKTLTFLKEANKKILPFCPFVFAYIKRHPEWKAIVDTRFKSYDQL